MVSTKDYLHLHFMVFIWGFTAVLGLLISLPALETVFYRTLLAFVGMVVYMIVTKRSALLVVSYNDVKRIFWVGIAVSLHWICFFAAGKVSNVSIALAGLSTTTLWTSILEPIMLRKRFSKLDFGFGLVIFIGLYIIFKFEFNHALGLFLGIAAAFLSALFSISNFKLIKQVSHYSITVYEMLSANIFTLVFLLIYSNVDSISVQWQPTFKDWIWLLILSQICTVYAFAASVEIMKRISAFLVNLTVNLEPIYGILLAYIVFGDSEKMSSGFYFGGFIILFAVFLYPIAARKLRKS